MQVEFQLARFGAGGAGEVLTTISDATHALERRLGRIDGPYAVKQIGQPFGSSRSLNEVLDDVSRLLATGELGLRLIVRGVDAAGSKIVIRKRPPRSDVPVLEYAFTQLGVDYVFGDEDPRGPEGGPGSAFDCSGLVKWCFAQVDVELPHGADLIMRDPAVTVFRDRAALRPGDLVFYSYEGAVRHADHVALFAGGDQQVAASSAAGKVALQEVDWPHEIALGRLEDVTGAR